MFVVHYNRVTGKICAWGNGESEQSHFPDCDIARFDAEFPLDPKKDKLDPSTLKLVPVVPDDLSEEAIINLRNLAQVELENTRDYMLVDADITPKQFEDWKAYRKSLRGFLKSPPATLAQMISSWPLNPDGKDAIVEIRARHSKEGK